MNEQTVEDRLKRIESRIVQLMLHLGLDPHKPSYKHDFMDR